MTEVAEPKKKEKVTRCPIEIDVTDDINKKRLVQFNNQHQTSIDVQ